MPRPGLHPRDEADGGRDPGGRDRRRPTARRPALPHPLRRHRRSTRTCPSCSAARPRRSPTASASSTTPPTLAEGAATALWRALAGPDRTLTARRSRGRRPRPRQRPPHVPPPRGRRARRAPRRLSAAPGAACDRAVRSSTCSVGSSESRTSTASPAPSAANAGSAPTRSPATCSAGWCRGAAAATSSSATAPASTSTSARHPEYATPECDSIHDLVVHDKAGERILEQLLTSAEERSARRASAATSTSSRTTPTPPATATAATRTTCTTRDDDFSAYAEVLIPFLVTRQIYAGAGKVLQTARGAHVLRQPAGRAHLGGGLAAPRPGPARSSTPATSPTPTPSSYRRLHVIVGDSNMSEYTNFLKVGACVAHAADARGPAASSCAT